MLSSKGTSRYCMATTVAHTVPWPGRIAGTVDGGGTDTGLAGAVLGLRLQGTGDCSDVSPVACSSGDAPSLPARDKKSCSCPPERWYARWLLQTDPKTASSVGIKRFVPKSAASGEQ